MRTLIHNDLNLCCHGQQNHHQGDRTPSHTWPRAGISSCGASNATACHQHVLNNHANETKGLSHNFLKNINKHLPSLLGPELGPDPQSCPLGSGSPAECSGMCHTGCRYAMLEGSSCRQAPAKHPVSFSLRGPVFATATEAEEPPEASQV